MEHSASRHLPAVSRQFQDPSQQFPFHLSTGLHLFLSSALHCFYPKLLYIVCCMAFSIHICLFTNGAILFEILTLVTDHYIYERSSVCVSTEEAAAACVSALAMAACVCMLWILQAASLRAQLTPVYSHKPAPSLSSDIGHYDKLQQQTSCKWRLPTVLSRGWPIVR